MGAPDDALNNIRLCIFFHSFVTPFIKILILFCCWNHYSPVKKGVRIFGAFKFWNSGSLCVRRTGAHQPMYVQYISI